MCCILILTEDYTKPDITKREDYTDWLTFWKGRFVRVDTRYVTTKLSYLVGIRYAL